MSTVHTLTARSLTLDARSLTWVNLDAKSVRAAISRRISGKSTRGSRAFTASRSSTKLGGSSRLSRPVKTNSSWPPTVSMRAAGLLGKLADTAR